MKYQIVEKNYGMWQDTNGEGCSDLNKKTAIEICGHLRKCQRELHPGQEDDEYEIGIVPMDAWCSHNGYSPSDVDEY